MFVRRIAMFDIFMKSKIELSLKAPGHCPIRPSRLDDAWRVCRAIDRALRPAEDERRRLGERVKDAVDSGTGLPESDGAPVDGRRASVTSIPWSLIEQAR
jgi:hypothetical protein